MVLKSLLPAGNRPGRPSQWSKRQLIDGIRWRVRVGAPWRDVPACYGSWQAIYALFRRWQRAGVWQQIVTGVQAPSRRPGRTGRATRSNRRTATRPTRRSVGGRRACRGPGRSPRAPAGAG
ncbi:transposase [Micromonospora echinaurantiaca]|uniref:transposase n=1 Tax=Micromonospora echinaurantiaca TaxID=47857 RepID=UPI0037B79C2B